MSVKVESLPELKGSQGQCLSLDSVVLNGREPMTFSGQDTLTPQQCWYSFTAEWTKAIGNEVSCSRTQHSAQIGNQTRYLWSTGLTLQPSYHALAYELRKNKNKRKILLNCCYFSFMFFIFSFSNFQVESRQTQTWNLWLLSSMLPQSL